jgi:2-polyprenyl-3-methyl-5-hydroxy-6-metoxy-1,4-benzoquinol methylase
MRLPSVLNVSTADRLHLLRAEIQPGMKVLEIGCAPGKALAYIAARLCAEVAGIDTSTHGLHWAHKLFETLNLHADLRCEDLCGTTFPSDTFDVVHSAGLIEHFEDPRDSVRQHIRLAKPGGVVLITIPNYTGIYGWLGDIFDPGFRKTHNLSIMYERTLTALPDAEHRTVAFRSGRFSLSSLDLSARLSPRVAFCLLACGNVAGLLQPIKVPFLKPTLVLKIVKNKYDRS